MGTESGSGSQSNNFRDEDQYKDLGMTLFYSSNSLRFRLNFKVWILELGLDEDDGQWLIKSEKHF
jgi:hypothetical protein